MLQKCGQNPNFNPIHTKFPFPSVNEEDIRMVANAVTTSYIGRLTFEPTLFFQLLLRLESQRSYFPPPAMTSSAQKHLRACEFSITVSAYCALHKYVLNVPQFYHSFPKFTFPRVNEEHITMVADTVPHAFDGPCFRAHSFLLLLMHADAPTLLCSRN